MSRRRFTYAFSQAGVRTFHGIVFGYEAKGTENVPLDGPCLLAANHKSYIDPPAIGACLEREIRYFAKRELFTLPLFGYVIRQYGAIPVDRAAFDRKTLRLALDILAGGEALLVFPEGTRIRRPGLGDAKEGIALLASQSGVPVVPVWVGHTYEPRRGIFRRIPIEVRFGPPIDFGDGSRTGEGDRRQRYAAMTAQVMAAIAELGGVETPASRVETAS